MNGFGPKNDKTKIANQRTRARSANKWLHPRIYTVLMAMTLWFVVWIWSFAGGGLSDYLLVVVSGFILVVVALTLILSRVGHGDPGIHDPGLAADADRDGEAASGAPEPFADWAASDFDTQAGRLHGIHAATQVLLPIGAAAVGMTAFGIVFLVVEHGGL